MKKITVPLFLLIILLIGCTTLEPVEVEDVFYTVSFLTYDGTTIESLDFIENSEIVLPSNPTKVGYEFAGWFTDEQTTIPYQIAAEIKANMTLHAKWTPSITNIAVKHSNDYLGSISIPYGVTAELAHLNYEYYTFLGWYSDIEYINEITSVTGNLANQTIYLKLEPKEVIIPVEEINITELPYYGYLSDTNPIVTITVKGVGVMTLELFPDVSTNTVDNFITYIQSESYTNSTFHRIIKDFMIQGGKVESNSCPINGDFSSNGFPNDLQHYRGVLSMARSNDFDSGTSQFFIMHADNHGLDGNYAAFGALTSGFGVLDYIGGIDTLSSDSPILPVVIETITIDLNGYEVGTVVCSN